jgi:hypothetical protein
MYLPFLRAKQYELLALRDFANEIQNSKIICPIIEPVKSELKGLDTAIAGLISKNVNFTIIANPVVGEIENPEHILKFISQNNNLKGYQNYQIGFNSFSQKQISQHLGMLNAFGLSSIKIAVVHNDVIPDEEFVKNNLNSELIKYNIFNNSRIKAKRYRRLFEAQTRISLDDSFISKDKNADYSIQTDEFFSDEYLNYEEEANIGFSDFLTIGEGYTDGGFLPYAVAIHITYESKDGSIRIRHFVSDSNDDYSDTPGKFAEALAKLIEFIPQLTFKTKAIEDFESHYRAGHYPGLGSIKKLSILHHLELMNKLLNQ